MRWLKRLESRQKKYIICATIGAESSKTFYQGFRLSIVFFNENKKSKLFKTETLNLIRKSPKLKKTNFKDDAQCNGYRLNKFHFMFISELYFMLFFLKILTFSICMLNVSFVKVNSIEMLVVIPFVTEFQLCNHWHYIK